MDPASNPARSSGEPRRTVLRRAADYIYDKLRWRLGLRIYGIYARPLQAGSASAPILPGFTSRRFESADAEALLSCRGRLEEQLGEAFVRAALAKGDACEAILCDGEIVSFSWHAFTPTHESEGVYVDFPKGMRYGYHAHTLPEYRGRHWPRLMTAVRDHYSRTRGATQTFAAIAVINRSSIRSSVGAGNRRVGFAGYLRRGRLFIPFRSPGARRLGIRFFLPDAPTT
ncbi:MAG: hypothetical protein HS128_02515 [Ideonella sp.]|nr:hypothetical protein [Ideonella sp.]MCC7458616.1 hypothetical protein [Nitrospira sp.]